MTRWQEQGFNPDILPPREVRIYDPLNYRGDERFPTALDPRGLVDINQVIEDVKATVDPSYVWPLGPKKNHHFYWCAEWYVYQHQSPGNPAAFRSLPPHRGWLPMGFEQWLHEVTLPVAPPDPQVRQYRIEAWTVAHNLFVMARKTIEWERRARDRRTMMELAPSIVGKEFGDEDIIAEECMTEVFNRNFRGLDMQVERNERIPPEFRVVEHSQPTRDIVRQLGSVVALKAVNLMPTIRARAA